jgi:hypothetical protein
MKLLGDSGFQIEVDSATAPLTLKTFRNFFEPNTLNIKLQTQNSSLWCYAACASMAIMFIKKADQPRQCKIASFVTQGSNVDEGLQHCCTTTTIDPVCVADGCKVGDIGLIYDHFGISFKRADDTSVLGQVDFEVLAAEFAAGRPVEVVVQWANKEGGGKHALLVTGIRGQMLFLLDPLNGHPFNGWCTIKSLQEGFAHGKWIRTWPELMLKP